jgi:NAD(P)-dependent dehydrogenase (short-subunit alcohol dehydrogenase family)
VAHAETEVGTIDILVNNSGVSTTPALVDVTAEDYDFVINTNTAAPSSWRRRWPSACSRAPRRRAGHLHRRAHRQHRLDGRTAKVLSQIGVYCMSKAAVVHMTRAMALEWGKFGINVNAICPGYIDTEINHHHWSDRAGKQLIDMLPRKRVGKPQDLDTALLMLCAKESHFINGAVIQADDGFGV